MLQRGFVVTARSTALRPRGLRERGVGWSMARLVVPDVRGEMLRPLVTRTPAELSAFLAPDGSHRQGLGGPAVRVATALIAVRVNSGRSASVAIT